MTSHSNDEVVMNDVDGNDDYYDGGNGADGRNVCVGYKHLCVYMFSEPP